MYVVKKSSRMYVLGEKVFGETVVPIVYATSNQINKLKLEIPDEIKQKDLPFYVGLFIEIYRTRDTTVVEKLAEKPLGREWLSESGKLYLEMLPKIQEELKVDRWTAIKHALFFFSKGFREVGKRIIQKTLNE